MNTLQRYIITACLTAITIFLVWYFGIVVKFILISAVLSFIGRPLVNILSEVKIKDLTIPSWLSATMTLVFMWGIAIVAIWILVPLIMEKINAVTAYDLTTFTNSFDSDLLTFELFMKNKFAIDINVSATLSDSLSAKVSEYITPTIIKLSTIFDKVISFVIGAFSVSFITFFFLRENALFKDGVAILFPSKYETNVKRALDSSTNLLSRYFIGLFVESTIKLIIISVALKLWIGLSVADAVVIGLISAILNVIPYIGPIIGALVGVIVAVASPELAMSASVDTQVFKMLIVFSAFQLIDNIIIQPYVYSSSVKAHPLEIFIVILLAGSLAGVTGMLLAIPAYTVMRVFAKEFFNKLRVVQKLTENI